MDRRLEKRIKDLRELLGTHLQYIYSLVESTYDKKTWNQLKMEEAYKALQFLNKSSRMVTEELEDIKKEDDIKSDPIIKRKVDGAINITSTSYITSRDMLRVAHDFPVKEKDLIEGKGWALEPTQNGIDYFKNNFGGRAWSGMRAAWSVLFFLTSDIATEQVKLNAFQTRAFFDSEDKRDRNDIIESANQRADEGYVVEILSHDGIILYATGPTETRTAGSHETVDWPYKYQRPSETKVLSRALTPQESRKLKEIVEYLYASMSSKDKEEIRKVPVRKPEVYYGERRDPGTYMGPGWEYDYSAAAEAKKRIMWIYLEDIVKEIGAPDLEVKRAARTGVKPLKPSIDTYITKDKYFVSKGKRLSRKLSRDEILYIKDVLKHSPGMSIENIAKGLFLDVVPMIEETQVSDIESSFQAQRATPNVGSYMSPEERRLFKKLWSAKF